MIIDLILERKEGAREYGFTDELRDIRHLYSRIYDAMEANGLND